MSDAPRPGNNATESSVAPAPVPALGKPLTTRELRQLVMLAKRALWGGKLVHQQLQAAGIYVSPANFYASIPSIRDVEHSFEYRREQLEAGGPYAAGGLFDHDRMAGFLERIQVHAEEFDPPLGGDPENPAGYFWKNPAFSYADAMAYYCVLRTIQPERVLEIGSGFSTLVADQALRRNGKGELIIVEPYPKGFLRRLPTVTKLIETPVQEIAEAELVRLVNSCQVWFIDSTHTVKSGSDCLYIYLKVMPQVTSQVMCHSHDIYLPYALPPKLALERNIFWTEQYLLQAYLLRNPDAQVMFGSAYTNAQMRAQGERLMRGRYPQGGGSLWYLLNGSGAQAHA
ncbi:class I SAM-dependent methyltransferase [Luteimonas sp. 50]|uniref:Class I SAM-dependent methyltransferase n=1 Tax=Cognatiluteimonas sedimenti TaxID=2927791 RepID=A0ABT0A6T1_9GAMM|nr:class I SAM-dependent methyltransferase [Lysobacter sedimenti]MCJ0826681.1 class I SAM-dependent methyltransferase [Lysobacter sedimenti]